MELFSFDFFKKEAPKVTEEEQESFEVPEQPEIPQLKENIAEVFRLNPELAKYGSEEQYLEYYKGIFPESKIPNILWHAEKKPLENGEYDFDKSRGDKPAMWFSQMRTPAHYFGDAAIKLYGNYEIPAKLNMRNPLVMGKKSQRIIDGVHMSTMAVTKEQIPIFERYGYDSMFNYLFSEADFEILTNDIKKWKYNDFAIFDRSQVHILGSKEDVEQFRKFVNNDL